ncbi:RimJ/RimL family protein N-acetyltransferase [Tumebacillus sp. BK434]|uniref:GNAT family N-acetyltransferase n=1 Tax=Tumebacillus sp. BK434 TaxID=2512169 RepID=UPI001043A29B|nr:GNAT family protein [Tumebacillus sp. BK434]TCP58165.1 RimJ/RimL family protein N-acetyltransferase [Tumebacillus sp. BK434]
MKPVKFLQGQKVYLRPFTAEDADIFYRSFYEPTGRYYTGTQEMFTDKQIADALDRFAAATNRVDLLICSQETNEPVGDISLNSMDSNNRSGSLRLAVFEPENYSKGYGTEALILMLDYGFGIRNLHRIELHVYSYNERAIHTYEKVGFKREGVMRDAWYYDHKWVDVIIMSILEDEFRAKYKRK